MTQIGLFWGWPFSMPRLFYVNFRNIMTKIQLKTNVKCGACVAAITPEMDKVAPNSWQVDLSHPDRILTVEGDLSLAAVQKALENAGYKGETINP